MITSDFKQLKVWQKSVDLAVNIFEITKTFPTEEKFGLVSQLRRCAFSIPSNIAEGQGRDSAIEFCRFINIARGSLCELETQIIISEKNLLISEDTATYIYPKIKEIGSMLKALSNYLKSPQNKQTSPNNV